MRHLIDITDLSVDEIESILDLADKMKANPAAYRDTMHGRILATLFFEPSTRTRLSFESAMLSLGGSVLGFVGGYVVGDEGRKPDGHHSHGQLLLRHHRHASPEGRRADGGNADFARADYQRGRRRTQSPDADADRLADDSHGARRTGACDHRHVRRLEIRAHGAQPDWRHEPLSGRGVCADFAAGTARAGIHHAEAGR